MTAIIACLIAGISMASFLILWFVTTKRELDRKKQEVAVAAEQVRMHRALYTQVRCTPNGKAAKRMLDTSRMIYSETVIGYNNCLKNSKHRFPGLIMGYRQILENDIDNRTAMTTKVEKKTFDSQ